MKQPLHFANSAAAISTSRLSSNDKATENQPVNKLINATH